MHHASPSHSQTPFPFQHPNTPTRKPSPSPIKKHKAQAHLTRMIKSTTTPRLDQIQYHLLGPTPSPKMSTSASASPSPLATTTDPTTPIYFWREYSSEPHAFLSQWYRAPFLAPLTPCQTPTFSPPSTPPNASDMQVFQTAEQYMMYRKAILFEDAHIAAKVLQTPNPKKQKALGRKVEGFEPAKWDVWKEGIVEEVNFPLTYLLYPLFLFLFLFFSFLFFPSSSSMVKKTCSFPLHENIIDIPSPPSNANRATTTNSPTPNPRNQASDPSCCRPAIASWWKRVRLIGSGGLGLRPRRRGR